MLLHKFISKRLVLGWVLVTAVLALSVQTALPQTESETPRPAERTAMPYLETTEEPLQTDQTFSATDFVPYSKLVFQSYRDSNWEIYSDNNDTTQSTRLTTVGAADIHPRFNRGLTRIVFASKRYGNYEIFTMNPDGTGLVQLTNNSSDDGNPYWSPDGSHIVFEAYRDEQAEIYVMNADGSGQTRLTYDSDFDGYPYWSPDGSKIAFTSRRTGGYRIYNMNIDGSGLVQLSEQPYSFNASWSPDGTQIAYDADADGDGWQELWLMNADGSNQHIVVDPDGTIDTWARDWSPDGRYITYTLIFFTYYQGNWYWTNAYLYSYNPVDQAYYSLYVGNLDWHPDWQTADTVPPTSFINTLPAQSPSPILVSWSGNDDLTGVYGFDVQVKAGANGTWVDWLFNTTDTSAAYDGVGGETYYFRIRARDKAHNIEQWPTSYDVFTTVESRPPKTAVSPLPPYFRLDVTPIIEWDGYDPGGSGIAHFDVQYSIENGSWTTWLTDTSAKTSFFTGATPGQTVHFRSRADDHAQNVEPWPGKEDTHTYFYNWGITGSIYDNTGTPIQNISVNTTPTPDLVNASNKQGIYGSYAATTALTYTVGITRAGYSTVPQTAFLAESDAHLDIVLPPADNIIANWGFENGSLSPEWVVGGTTVPTINTTSHTGDYAVLLGETNEQLAPTIQLSAGKDAAATPNMKLDSTGVLHLVWADSLSAPITTNSLKYTQRLSDGTWIPVQTIPEPVEAPRNPNFVVDSSGNVHLVWIDIQGLYYATRNTNGTWSTPQLISEDQNMNEGTPQIGTNSNGDIHIIWTGTVSNGSDSLVTDTYYRQRTSSGSWSTIENLFNSQDGYPSYPQMVVDDQDTVHLIWDELNYYGVSGIFYMQRPNSGEWTSPQNIALSDEYSFNLAKPCLIVDHNLHVHVAWYDDGGLFYRYRELSGVWNSPHKIEVASDYTAEYDMVLGPDNLLRFVWNGRDGKVYFIQKDSNNVWSAPHNISEVSDQIVFSIQITVDIHGDAHVVWSNQPLSSDLLYYARQIDGAWQPPQLLSHNNPEGAFDPVQIAQTNGLAHIVFSDIAIGGREVYYIGTVTSNKGSDSSISQTISIPLTMTAPTLSFLYQLEGVTGDEANLVVNLDNGTTITNLVTLDTNTGGWSHQFVDLTSWAGQTVTITFDVHQVANTPVTWALLDEITIGNAHPDDWLILTDFSALPGEQTVHTLTYGNQGGAVAENSVISYTLPAEISFVSASVPPTSVNGSVLVWEVGSLPAKSEPFTIVVTGTVSPSAPPFEYLTSTAVIATTATELETLNNVAVAQTFIGRFTYLPVVFKN